MTRRQAIPEPTKRILYLKSRNTCAFPGCDSPLVALPLENSPHKIIGEICHIHSDKEKGPRGRGSLPSEQNNVYDNLIMLCPTHHRVVDGQHESYPAETLKEWKETHEAKSYTVSSEDLYAPPEKFYHSYFPTALVDQTIEEEVNLLRKSRFFVEFDGTDYALALSRRLWEGDLYGGTATVKASALAWCARILTGGEELVKAEECLTLAEKLGADTKIARAFIYMRKRGRNEALRVLAGIDSPNSRSAVLSVVGNLDGPVEAVDHLNTDGIGIRDLDPDGKFILIRYQLELGLWKAALESAETLNESDFEEAPVLHHMVAMAYLLSTVPPDYRNVVLRHVPLNASTFPLAFDAASIEIRRTARTHFISAKEVAQGFGCPGVAAELDGYAIWLELRDPGDSDSGKLKLEDRLRDVKSALHLIPLCLQYGIPIDLANVEQVIERQILQGEHSQDAAFARLAMARRQENPEDIANYFDRHFNTFSAHLDTKAIRFIQIEIFAIARLTGRAKECLDLLSEEGLSEAEERRYRLVIAKAEGNDTLEGLLELFKQTGSLTDLEALVKELEDREDWDEVCEYGEILFEKTHSVHDAEQLASALHNSYRFGRIVELLQAHKEILEQSTILKYLQCWALFFGGDLLSARCELEKLEADWEDENYRTLQIDMSIALGDWDSLSASIASGYRKTENKSARELVRAAELSLYLNLRSAKELLFKAAEKGKDDADVLSHVYFLATRAGLEADEEVANWLHRAVELSGEDGPLWTVTAHDILDLKPEWDRQEYSIKQLLYFGEIPMFSAAQFLSKSLINLTLFPALARPAKHDLRLKVGVSAFSGQREASRSFAGGTIGLDYTALLTLGYLGLLDSVFNAFDTVYVPHSALAWLFVERQNASFHQPSRIKEARQILDLYSGDSIEMLSPATVADRELPNLVGDELAKLIAEAEDATLEDTQRLVVRPNPVYKISTLGKEEADLSRHSTVLSSCQAVVRKLCEMGEIIESEEQTALAQLRLRLKEKPWPHQPEISDKAILYLDDLAVHYLLHTKMLEELLKAGFTLIVSPSVITESNALISYEGISGKVLDVIENMRAVVSQGIKSGRVKVGKWRSIVEGEEKSIADHQMISFLALTEDCDAIIADDRCFNQLQHIEYNGVQTPLWSTLDLLDAYGWPQCQDHEMGKIRCIQTAVASADQSA